MRFSDFNFHLSICFLSIYLHQGTMGLKLFRAFGHWYGGNNGPANHAESSEKACLEAFCIWSELCMDIGWIDGKCNRGLVWEGGGWSKAKGKCMSRF